MAHPVSWFQISGSESVPLQAFYKKVFSWRMKAGPGGGPAMVDADEGGIPGGVGASTDGKSSIAIYVSTNDLAGHLKKIQDAGGSVAMPPLELPAKMGWIAGFLDPAGNWVGLWQPAKKTAPSRKRSTARKKPARARRRGRR